MIDKGGGQDRVVLGDWRGGDGFARVGNGSARAASAGDGLGSAGRCGLAQFGLRFACCAVPGGGVGLSHRGEGAPATFCGGSCPIDWGSCY